jgi:GTP-binding protein HflX
MTLERDLEDFLMERAARFYDATSVRPHQQETCYLVGLEDRSLNERDDASRYTLEESMTELSELAGAAGLVVCGSTYQRVARPSIEYYIGPGKLKDIVRSLGKLKCSCVVFDVELSPAQQKNLELSFNQEKHADRIKVLDRTALILDIFAQHARTKEGQLQVQLALLTYRLPRLTNMWTHLERQSAGARGRSNGGVGLRGPGEKQLESDRRQMKSKISLLNRAIDSVRRHRSSHRSRRRRLGLPVVAMVGYTNAGKSTLLNSFTSAGVFAADMLFATLDPTTRLVRLAGMRNPDILLTDTVGFIQKLPTNLVAAFRATLEEIAEADVLLHVTDVSNDAWRKQEAAVLRELHSMGLASKPIVTVWNKIDLVPDRKEFLKFEAAKRAQTVAVSAATQEGFPSLMRALEGALSSQMEYLSATIAYKHVHLVNSVHNLGILDEVQYLDEGVFVRGRLPLFLKEQVESRANHPEDYWDDDDDDVEEGEEGDDDAVRGISDEDLLAYSELDGLDAALLGVDVDVTRVAVAAVDAKDVDWTGLAKGRHAAVRRYSSSFASASSSGGAGGGGNTPSSLSSSSRGILGRQRLRSKASAGPNKKKEVAAATVRGAYRDDLDDFLQDDSGDYSSDEFDDSKLLDFDAGDFDGSQALARAAAAAEAAARADAAVEDDE